MTKLMNRLIILMVGLSTAWGIAGAPLPVDYPDYNTLVLVNERMTFKRIAPRKYGGDAADFFLQESEVTSRMYAGYLVSTKQTKGDQELADQERARKEAMREPGYVWTTADPVYDLGNPGLLWTNNTPPTGLNELPVALISIHEAIAFCEWLTKRYPETGLMRLPTRSEWVMAAYGKERKYPWGDEWSPAIPCISLLEESRRSLPAAVKTHARDRTPEGIYDLWGNVSEYILEANEYPVGARWMGGSFKSFPRKDGWPFIPRNDYWGYVHDAKSRMENVGFRVLIELNLAKPKNLISQPQSPMPN